MPRLNEKRPDQMQLLEQLPLTGWRADAHAMLELALIAPDPPREVRRVLEFIEDRCQVEEIRQRHARR